MKTMKTSLNNLLHLGRIIAKRRGGEQKRLLHSAGFAVALVAGLALATGSALAAAPEKPQALAPSPLLATTATLHGTLNPGKTGGPFEIDTYEFVYRQSATECKGAGEVTTPANMAAGDGEEQVSAEVEGLTAGSKYTVCVIVHNEAGTESATSAPLTFETPEAIAPVIDEQRTEEGQTKNAATVAAVINPGGAETTCEVEYGKTAALEATPVSCPAPIPAGTNPAEVTPELTGLEPNTEYHFKFVATNAKGTTEATSEATFTTHPAVGVTTEAATVVKRAHAILHGSVDPERVDTDYYYEYGPCELATEACGMRTPSRGPVKQGFPEPIEPFTVYRLKPGSTYHYRLVATSEGATFYGAEETFTTASAEPEEYIFDKKLEGHELPAPAGVAVNETTGNVYVTNQYTGAVEQFSAAGVWQSSTTMSEPGPAWGVAVDNSCFFKGLTELACKSTDPSNGDVYVVSVEGGFVYKFDPSANGGLTLDPTTPEIGKGQLPPGPPETPGGAPTAASPRGVAVDTSGDVYVTSEAGTVSKFTATGELVNAELVKGTPRQARGLAIDTAGNIYLAGEGGPGTIEYTPAGLCAEPEPGIVPEKCERINSGLDEGVALDAAGDVFISRGGIYEYAPTAGHPAIANPELEGAGLFAPNARGLAVNDTSNVLYAGDYAEQAEMFRYVAAKPVIVKTEPATQVGGTVEKLNALVNPNGDEAAEYDFEFGVSPCDTTTETCGTVVTEDNQSPLHGEEAIPVSVRLEHLTPHTTYHYWVVAANEESGAEHGEEQTFTTGSLEPANVAPGDQSEHKTPAGEEPAAATVFPSLSGLAPVPGPKVTTKPAGKSSKPKACKKGFTRKHGRCVRKAKKAKQKTRKK